MIRAYAVLEVKSVDEDKRIITGIATTPSVDRQDDIVESDGAEFKLPLPLLWQHNSNQPIGHVIRAKVTKDGIEVTAQFVKSDEPGTLKDRLDEAWQSVKLGLVRGLSIGFKAVETARIEGTYGVRFLKWLWLELSAVTIPANQDATITSIKSIDAPLLAATRQKAEGQRPSDPSRAREKINPIVKALEGNDMKKTYAEQISAFEATRQAKQAEMDTLMEKSMESGTTFDRATRKPTTRSRPS
jgi:HK97 family phage prohead protease